VGSFKTTKLGTAAARQAFNTILVGDHKPCPSIVNEMLFAQALCDAGNAWAVNTENACNMLVRYSESVALASALKRKEPAAKPLFHRVECIAHHPLRKLSDLRVDVVMQCYLQPRIGVDFALEKISSDDECRTRDTDLHAVRRSTRMKRRRDSDGTLAADDPDFDHPSVFEYLKFRNDRCFREIYVVDLVVLLVMILIFGKVYAFQKRSQSHQMLRADILKQAIRRRSDAVVHQ
jgi:hypothetical protein